MILETSRYSLDMFNIVSHIFISQDTYKLRLFSVKPKQIYFFNKSSADTPQSKQRKNPKKSYLTAAINN